jgi:hypothetical protein
MEAQDGMLSRWIKRIFGEIGLPERPPREKGYRGSQCLSWADRNEHLLRKYRVKRDKKAKMASESRQRNRA